MKLMTKALQNKIPKLRETERQKNVRVYVHYFHPFSNWDWYGLEYDPEERIFFGYVKGFEGEYGHFSLNELEAIPYLERDLYWDDETTIEEILNG